MMLLRQQASQHPLCSRRMLLPRVSATCRAAASAAPVHAVVVLFTKQGSLCRLAVRVQPHQNAGCPLCSALEEKLRGVLDVAAFQPDSALCRAVLEVRGWEGGCREDEAPRVAVQLSGAADAQLLAPLSPRLPASKLGKMLESALEAAGVVPAPRPPQLKPVDWRSADR
jgi:hypothetical protein